MPEPAIHSNIGLYRSGVTSPERLRHTSVARGHLLHDAIESLRGSVGRKSKSHLLFIGPRGIGKTHLLSCIEDAVQSDEVLGASIVVVRFPEESNRTLVLRRLPDRHVRDIEGSPRRRTAVDGAVRRSADRGRRRQGRRHAGARNSRRESQARPDATRHAREPGRDPHPANPRQERRRLPSQISNGRQRLPADGHRSAALRRHHRRRSAVLRLLRHSDSGEPGLRGNG